MEDKNKFDFEYSYIAITNLLKSSTKITRKELKKEMEMLKLNFNEEEIKAMSKARVKNE